MDDCFWVAPEFPDGEGPNSSWQYCVFEYVVQELLGWRLDPAKTELGHKVTLLGIQVNM